MTWQKIVLKISQFGLEASLQGQQLFSDNLQSQVLSSYFPAAGRVYLPNNLGAVRQ